MMATRGAWVVFGCALSASACGSGGSSGGMGGSGGGNVPPGPPVVDELTPTEGPYGTIVSVRGAWLGSAARTDVALVLGGTGEVVLEPDDASGALVSWTESEIQFQLPFPAEGPVSIETPEGAALAGDFTPSWSPGPSAPAGPAIEAIASVSPVAGTIAVLLASGKLVVIDDSEVTEHSVDAGSADLETATLFVGSSGAVEGLALTGVSPNELVHLQNDQGNLVAQSTGISGAWSEALLSGGYAWVRDDSGWSRVSSQGGAFAIDVGPIADPAPSNGLRAAAATDDGALHVVWNVDTGDFFDDLEAPHMASVPPGGTAFDAGTKVGVSLDDYLTILELEGRGAGMKLHWCGSDVDPVLGTPPEEACRTAYLSSGGTTVKKTFTEDDTSRYVFTSTLVGGAYCAGDGALTVTTDAASDGGEVAVWPCPRLLAVEIDADGWFLPVVVHEDRLYSPRRR